MSNGTFIPTESQLRAINARGNSVLVSAGAGSGKTSLLVSRVIKRITEENINIDDFVIITFTKAAAAELRGRLAKELSEVASKNPDNEHLMCQTARSSQAKIGTIHSFCGQILREHSRQGGVSPSFTIISDEKRNAIKSRCLEKLLDSCYENISEIEGFELLVNTAGLGRDDKSLFDLVLSLHENMLSHPDAEAWADLIYKNYDLDVQDAIETPWGRDILDGIKLKLEFYIDEFSDLIQIMSCDEKLSKNYVPSMSSSLLGLEEAMQACEKSWDEAVRAISGIAFDKFGLSTGTTMPDAAERAKTIKKKCSDYIKKASAYLSSPSAQLLEEMRSSAPAMKALLKLTLDFDALFKKEKMRLDCLDYSDLEHYAYEMLQNNPDLKQELSDRYAEIMVDEYQDVNAIQDAIFNAVSNDGQKLFMVGDVKQSIYSFRLADPSIFIKKSEKIPPIALTDNFRSRKEVINCINSVFTSCMSKDLGDVVYDDSARLQYHASYEGSVPEPEVIIYERSEDEEKHSFEASRVGQMIIELSSQGYRFGDMAILLRSISESASIYRDELQSMGIPVVISQSSSFFTQNEICEIIDRLNVIDNPNNDISLISALRTSGFTADDLSKIRSADGNRNLYYCLKQTDSDKCREFLEKLSLWREKAKQMTMDQLLLSIDWPVTDNLLEMVKHAVSFESEGYHGVHHFVKYLERSSAIKQDSDDSSNKINAVHIMTIHKSKGLEFPVVFLCDTYHKFNFTDATGTVLVHPELGLGPKFYDTANKICYPTLARTAIASRIRSETRSEEMRLLYVALTRAKERLIITASSSKEIKPPVSLKDANTPIEWLISTDIPVKKIPYGEDFDTVCLQEKDPEEVYSSMPNIEYGFDDAVKIPASISATEYKKFVSPNLEETSKGRFFRKPDFSENSKIKATDRGSAMHKVLQYMSLTSDVKEEIARLLEQGFICQKDADAVDVSALENFLASPLGMRIKTSTSVRREFNFLVLTDSSELLNTGISEEILLNGIVDCCFEEDGQIVIVDYKTDKTDRSEMYAPQIKAYSIALEKIFGQKIKEAYIYYLNLGYEKRIAI